MKKMTADRCVEIVESAIKKDPTEPVRIDFHLDQLEEIRSAHEKLFYRNGEFEQWFEKLMHHPEEELSQKGFMRVAFIGPEGPSPVRVVEAPICDDNRSSQRECEIIQSRLQKEYGDGYHVEISVGSDPSKCPYCCEVWRGADWLRWEKAAYTCKEISDATTQLKGAQYRNREMKALADRKSAGEKLARLEGRVGHRPPERWNDMTLRELVEEFVADSIAENKFCRGIDVAQKKAEEWDNTWAPDTIRKALGEEWNKQKGKT